MEGKKKIAIILSNTEYQRNRYPPRKGGKKDAEDVRTALQKLNFEVTLHENLSYKKIHEVLLALSKPDDKNIGCLIVVAMTHGSADKLEAFDEPLLTKTLWNFFVDDCPSLNGVPKLIFIQACRGKDHDSGVSVTNLGNRTATEYVKIHEQLQEIAAQKAKAMEEPLPEKDRNDLIEKSMENEPSIEPPTSEDTKKPKIGSQTEVQTGDIRGSQTDSMPMGPPNEVTGNENVFGSLKVGMPTTPDLLVMYSAIDGLVSWRNEIYGSCFIQSLCAELKANGDKKELLQMLTSVSRMVACHFKFEYQTKDSNEKKISKQMACFESTLTKQLYLA